MPSAWSESDGDGDSLVVSPATAAGSSQRTVEPNLSPRGVAGSSQRQATAAAGSSQRTVGKESSLNLLHAPGKQGVASGARPSSKGSGGSNGSSVSMDPTNSEYRESDDELNDGEPIPDDVPRSLRKRTSKDDKQELAAAIRRIQQLEKKLQINEVQWSSRHKAEVQNWSNERESLESQLRELSHNVEDLHQTWRSRGEDMLECTRDLAKENDLIHQKSAMQTEIVSECSAEIQRLRRESEDLRQALTSQESEVAAAKQLVQHLESELQQETERLVQEQNKTAKRLEHERLEKRRLEGECLEFQQKLQNALASSTDSVRRHNEARLLEVEKRKRLESEVAEARREVAWTKEALAAEQAQRLVLVGTSSNDDTALADREWDLYCCRSDLRSAEQDASAARERASAAIENMSKAAADSIVNRQEMLAERDKSRWLVEAVSQRDSQISDLMTRVSQPSGYGEEQLRRIKAALMQAEARWARHSALCPAARAQALESSDEPWSCNGFEALALQLSPPSQQEQSAGARVGQSPSHNQSRAASALERQFERLAQRAGSSLCGSPSPTSTSLVFAPAPLGTRGFGNAVDEAPLGTRGLGNAADEAAGAAAGTISRPLLKPVGVKDMSVEQSGAAHQALDRAACRLERLHSRLTGLSPSRLSAAVFDNAMRSN